MDFKLHSDYKPTGDQPNAIRELTEGVNNGVSYQTLLGVTGSGKTFTMANVIANTNKPTLILSHNKTLAAQLYAEFKAFFPENSVHYFVSYYDYYQPEAYIPSTDKYIEKDLAINEEIDRLRLATTAALLSGRRDIIVVSSVSCIYGMGNPADFDSNAIYVQVGQNIGRDRFLTMLVDALYSRSDAQYVGGTFRVVGDTVDVSLAYEKIMVRIIFWGNEIETIQILDVDTQLPTETVEAFKIYPANLFVASKERVIKALGQISVDLGTQVDMFYREDRPVEARRLKERVEYDIEMIREVGYCSGIENYSAPISNRKKGEPPATLLHYFPSDFLCMIDEAHVSVPQIGAMYEGDRSRKQNLVDFGFRLPSALDNRPLKFDEFSKMLNQVIYVTATPRKEEIEKSTQVVEQLIRPTGLLDPIVEVRPTEGQMEDIYREIKERIEKNERSLVLTLTKKMAEDLTDYLSELNLKVKYIHSEIDTFERVEILKSLRTGEIDVLIGINLLREGIDLPEVSFIALLDADKIGFLRSATSLIQIIGRAARNSSGMVVMYADRMSEAMKEAIDETQHRRSVQEAYNKAHGIEPKTVKKEIQDILEHQKEDAEENAKLTISTLKKSANIFDKKQRKKLIDALKKEMSDCAERLEYEQAAAYRDQILELEKFDKR